MEYETSQKDFDTLFLSLYEEVKKRFKEKGIHATIETLERCQAILQAFLEEGRPLKPYELVEKVVDNPAFSQCKHGRSMASYTLKKMVEIGILEKREFMGRRCYYHLAEPLRRSTMRGEPETPTGEGASMLLDGFRRLQELKSIMGMWGIPSLATAIAYEGERLLEKAEDLRGYTQRGLIEPLQRRLKELDQLIEASVKGDPPQGLDELIKDIGAMIRELHLAEKTLPSLSLNNRRPLRLREKSERKSMREAGKEEEELSTAFLRLYEEVKKRLKELGLRGDLQTLEKLQAMLLVFLEKGRPLRPYELVDALVYNPAYARCKDARRMVFYVLERLVKTGVVEKVPYKGAKSYYRLARHSGIRARAAWAISKPKDPRAREILDRWRRIFELRSITRLWRLSSLGHALVFELHGLQEKLMEFPGGAKLEDPVNELIEVYTGYAATGTVPTREPELFHRLGRCIKSLSWSPGEAVWP